MPTWSKKRRRQYEHIRESAEDRGASAERAKEIAARTVNKNRREHGETPNRRTEGTGNPRRSLGDRTKDELYNLAKERNIRGRSRMNKTQLVSALQHK